MRCQFYDGRTGGRGRCTRPATHEVKAFFSHVVCLKHAREFKAANRIEVIVRKLKS